MLTGRDGKKLLNLARNSASSYLANKNFKIEGAVEKEYSAKQGVFVTLTIEGELRGCIGYPEPILPLAEAVASAARAAAFEDPRFPSVNATELEKIRFEVSVLTVPEEIIYKDAKELPKKIEIGKDGLIIRKSFNSGLLLPQVATEYNWSPEEFLDNLCMKAGLSPAAWKKGGISLWKFSAQIFTED